MSPAASSPRWSKAIPWLFFQAVLARAAWGRKPEALSAIW